MASHACWPDLSLDREERVRIAHEYMLGGMIATRAMMPLVVLMGGDMDLMNQVAIDEWMGASPVYTARMRRLMGIDGDDVVAIMKALQLDVGFVHQYMDVGYRVIDPHHAEFWLAHCGALLDAEEHGEERVFGMCHTIEDPTFDATALATNPRARIRPIHRPPRTPADRHPHCHWTIAIDEANEPVGPVPLTERVAALALATVPNPVPVAEGPGLTDGRGDFDPAFRLRDLDDGALTAVTREFQMQTHLLMSATDLTVRDHFGDDGARELVRDAWLGASWITGERLAGALGRTEGTAADVAAVLASTPMLPPGVERRVAVEDGRVRLTLREAHAGVLDPSHPGWSGALARGVSAGVDGTVGGVTRAARVAGVDVAADVVVVDVEVDPGAPVAEPELVALNRIGRVAAWTFDPTR